MKHPAKWRETIDPFTLKFRNFKLEEILGYPHAGNDVFHVRGRDGTGVEIRAFLKVERQKSADIEREVKTIWQLDLPFVPTIIDYSFTQPKYVLTLEMEGKRLSQLLKEDKELAVFEYLNAYGELLAKIHALKPKQERVKERDFALRSEFYQTNQLQPVKRFLREAKESMEPTTCFIHGDCHYANILWKDGQVSALLDFELSGYGSREYDLAWALVLRPGQKFLATEAERQAVLKSYSKFHKFSQTAFDYYSVLFGMFFYSISLSSEEEVYRKNLLRLIHNIMEKAQKGVL